MILKYAALVISLFCQPVFGFTDKVIEGFRGRTFQLISFEDETGTQHRLCTGGDGPNECFAIESSGLELCIFKDTGFDCRKPLSAEPIE